MVQGRKIYFYNYFLIFGHWSNVFPFTPPHPPLNRPQNPRFVSHREIEKETTFSSFKQHLYTLSLKLDFPRNNLEKKTPIIFFSKEMKFSNQKKTTSFFLTKGRTAKKKRGFCIQAKYSDLFSILLSSEQSKCFFVLFYSSKRTFYIDRRSDDYNQPNHPLLTLRGCCMMLVLGLGVIESSQINTTESGTYIYPRKNLLLVLFFFCLDPPLFL